MRRKILLLSIFILSIFVYGESEIVISQSYVLKEINYEVKGSTNIKLLERKLNYHKGMVFKDLKEMEAFVIYIEQELHNLRYYEEVRVLKKIEDNGLKLFIYLDEAWGIIPFGFPKTDSDDGHRLSLKLFWYNTLGTLTNTSLTGGFNYSKDDGEDNYKITKWDSKLKFDELFIYGRYYNLSLEQKLDRDKKGESIWSFHSSEISTGTSFNLLNNFNYSPKLSLTVIYGYRTIQNIDLKDIDACPLRLTYSHSISSGKIDWIGNLQDGYKYSLSNGLHLVWDSEKGYTPSTDFKLSGKFYKKLGELPISFGGRLTGVASINEEQLDLGDENRGIKGAHMYGNYGVFLNTNLYISTIKIDGLAEAIFAPSFDIGISEYYNDNSESKPESNRIKYSAGADFVLYVNKLKSLTARGTLSWDLSKEINLKNTKYKITSSLYF